MTTSEWITQLHSNLPLAIGVVALLSILLFVLFRYGIARMLMKLAARSKSKIDDILVRHLHPYRMAWLAPLAVIYITAFLFPEVQVVLAKVSLFFILWITVLTLSGLLNAINEIYENRPNYNGVSIQGYLDIARLLFVVVGIILSITLLTDESPIVLLTGLGAIAAVIMLIFQNTILSLVASIQIAANDLLKEGDWVEVPSYEADGDVVNINLHTIKIRNFDMTYSVIPTYKIVDVAFRNWRGMKESGGRRIQRSVTVDMVSIKFCDAEMLARLGKIDLLGEFLAEKTAHLEAYKHGARRSLRFTAGRAADHQHRGLPGLYQCLPEEPSGYLHHGDAIPGAGAGTRPNWPASGTVCLCQDHRMGNVRKYPGRDLRSPAGSCQYI